MTCKQGITTITDPVGVFTPQCGKLATETIIFPNGKSETMCESHARNFRVSLGQEAK